jgi:tryptophan synthase beta chain
MFAYERFHDGKMTDYTPSDEDLAAGRAKLPMVP